VTVSATTIALVSPFTVGAIGDFTDADLALYKTIAAARLEGMYPGLSTTMSSSLYDYCHALMICHLYKASRGNVEKKSESYGDVGWSKDPGATSYLVTLRETVEEWKTGQAAAETVNEGVERADHDVPDLKMCQADLPEPYDDSEVDTYD
jgi:hypothetical protein